MDIQKLAKGFPAVYSTDCSENAEIFGLILVGEIGGKRYLWDLDGNPVFQEGPKLMEMIKSPIKERT